MKEFADVAEANAAMLVLIETLEANQEAVKAVIAEAGGDQVWFACGQPWTLCPVAFIHPVPPARTAQQKAIPGLVAKMQELLKDVMPQLGFPPGPPGA